MKTEEYDELLKFLAENTSPVISVDNRYQLAYDQGFSEMRSRAINYLKGIQEETPKEKKENDK